MDRQTYLSLLRSARRRTQAGEEADLLQTALVLALEAQRLDLTLAENRRWLAGVLRNRALHEARTAARRRRRETSYVRAARHSETASDGGWRAFVLALPPALRTTALLAVTGHTKAEIAWLLSLSDAALRRRISDIRQRWGEPGARVLPRDGGLRGSLSFGLLRAALLRPVRSHGAVLGTHDPDGHLIVLSSQSPLPRQPRTSEI